MQQSENQNKKCSKFTYNKILNLITNKNVFKHETEMILCKEYKRGKQQPTNVSI